MFGEYMCDTNQEFDRVDKGKCDECDVRLQKKDALTRQCPICGANFTKILSKPFYLKTEKQDANKRESKG